MYSQVSERSDDCSLMSLIALSLEARQLFRHMINVNTNEKEIRNIYTIISCEMQKANLNGGIERS